jgi:hypothetical protein
MLSGPSWANRNSAMPEKQFRWALELTGSRIDIEDAIRLFGAESDPSIITIDDAGTQITVLISPQLDSLDSAREVDEVAKRLLATVNGILFVLEPARDPLKAAGVRERKAEGKWNFHFVPAAGLIIARGRARASGMAIASGAPAPEHLRPPRAVRWSAAAQSDQVIADVFVYLSGEPDWFNFYKAFELMRDGINQRLGGQHRQEQMGWPAKKELDHFTLSAQVYRHAPPWDGGYTPSNAMHIGKASRYIQSLAAGWLAWRLPDAT